MIILCTVVGGVPSQRPLRTSSRSPRGPSSRRKVRVAASPSFGISRMSIAFAGSVVISAPVPRYSSHRCRPSVCSWTTLTRRTRTRRPLDGVTNVFRVRPPAEAGRSAGGHFKTQPNPAMARIPAKITEAQIFGDRFLGEVPPRWVVGALADRAIRARGLKMVNVFSPLILGSNRRQRPGPCCLGTPGPLLRYLPGSDRFFRPLVSAGLSWDPSAYPLLHRCPSVNSLV